ATAGGAGRGAAQGVPPRGPRPHMARQQHPRVAPLQRNQPPLPDPGGGGGGLAHGGPRADPEGGPAPAVPPAPPPLLRARAEANACFGSRMGWERPNFFAPPGEAPVIEYSWGAQNWLPWVAAEQRATRTGVAVFDQTSFSKYLLTGPGSEQALQWLCTADV